MQWRNEIAALSARTPIFLARPLDELVEDCETRNSRSTLFLLCEAAESLLRFLAIVASAELIHRNNGVAPEWLAKAAERLLVVPTFGSLREFLSIVAENQRLEADGLKVLEEFPSVWPDLNEALFRKDSGDPSPERRNLIEVRNPLAHGSGINEKYARDLLEIWGPRFAEALNLLPWLIELELWTRDETSGLLRLVGLEPTSAAAPDEFINGIVVGDVVLRRSEANVPLVPMSYRRSPRDGIEAVAQLFVRQGPLGLLYELFESADMLQAQGGAKEREKFEAMFDLTRIRRATRERQYQERGYDREFEADARTFVARAEALDELWNAVIDRPRGIVGVIGRAGVGKSSLVAKVTVDLRAELTERTRLCTSREMVLAYRFTDGDRGCAPLPFLRWLIERLQDLEDKTRPLKPTATFSDLREHALRQIASLSCDRLVLVLDGLDELARRESRFVRDFIERTAKVEKLLVVASSRPDPSIQEAMIAAGAFLPWPDGLPGMSSVELRIMLVSLLPRAAKRLVNDDTFTKGVRNAFMDAVVARANDLPLYVALVVQATHDPGFRPNDLSDPGWLPTGVEAFFHRIVTEGALSDKRRAGPLVGCLLALAHAPLSAGEIGALLGRSQLHNKLPWEPENSVISTDRHVELTGQVLANLGGLLRRGDDESGIARFRLLHDDLRTYVLGAPELQNTVREASVLLAGSALKPGDDAASNYLCSYGIQHILETDPGTGDAVRAAADLLADFKYQYRRLETLAPEGGDGGIRDDWALVAKSGAQIKEVAAAWRNFWATGGAEYHRGPGRNAPREFVEDVVAYAPETSIGRAVDAAESLGALVEVPLLVPRTGSRIRQPDAVVATLPPTSGGSRFLALPNSTILVWSLEGGAWIWDSDGILLRKLEDENETPIQKAVLLDGGNVLTMNKERLRVFSSGGELLAERKNKPKPGPFYFEAYSYPPDRILLFGKLDNNHGETLAYSKMQGNGRAERYVVDIFTSDLMERIDRIGLPHRKEPNFSRVFDDGTIFTMSSDCARVWRPGPELIDVRVHDCGYFCSNIARVSQNEFLCWNSGQVILFTIRSDEFELIHRWKGVGYLEDCQLLPDRRALFSVLEDARVALVELDPPYGLAWLQDRQEPKHPDYANVAGRARYLPEAERIVAMDGDSGLAFWKSDGTPVAERKRYTSYWWSGAAALPDGRILVWSESCLFVIFGPDGEVEGEAIDRFESTKGTLGQVWQVEILPNGRIAVSVQGAVSILRPEGISSAPQSSGHGHGIAGILELEDGGLVSAGLDDLMILWDTAGVPRIFFEGHDDCVNGVLELDDGRIVSWSDDGTVRLWSRGSEAIGEPLMKHECPIAHVIKVDAEHLLATDTRLLMLVSISEGRNPVAVQQRHKSDLLDVSVLRSGRVLSRDLDGRLIEWTPFKERTAEFVHNGFFAWQSWEAEGGEIVAYGAPKSPGALDGLPDPIKWAQIRELPKSVLLWSAEGERASKVITEGSIDKVLPVGANEFICIGTKGTARLLRIENNAADEVATIEGVLNAFAISDRSALLMMGAPGDAGYMVMNPEVSEKEQIMMAGSSDPEVSHWALLDVRTGKTRRIGSLGRPDTVIDLPRGGFATLFRAERQIRCFDEVGRPRSNHHYVGEACFFGKWRNGEIGLLTTNGGQLMVYDLVAAFESTTSN